MNKDWAGWWRTEVLQCASLCTCARSPHWCLAVQQHQYLPATCATPPPTHRLHKASVAKFKHLWAFPSWSRYAPGPVTQTLPPSNLTNTVKYDRLGRARSAVANAPGAYVKE